MATVTFDTNLVDDEELFAAARVAGFAVAHTTVTNRELSGSGVVPSGGRRGDLLETAVVGESIVGLCVVGSDSDARNFERVLEIISSGSFPQGAKRNTMSQGQQRQVRDAMIFCTHVRETRDVFVTNDLRGFIRRGHRETLEREFSTKIHTAEEFLKLCHDSQGKTNI